MAFPTDATLFPRDGNPFTEGWGPLFQIYGAPFTKGSGPLYRWMGTPFPRDGKSFVSGWQRLIIDIFNESEIPHAVVGPMNQVSGGGHNASPTADV